ncbi:MAG TPA: STAS domain-containing protein [Caulobacteraceae bacterium]|jgi:chemotaxis protein CheX|nr:STAS domain-containing protein [Caulobacteraceae bacterium]
MDTSPDTVTVKLPEVLGLTAAAPLAARLVALQGSPVVLDASKVMRLGGLCLQVLLSARVTWMTADTPLTIHDPSPAFQDAWALFGAPALSA